MFWLLLGGAFALVGVALVSYNLNAKQLMQTFARSHGLQFSQSDARGLGRRLSEALALEGTGISRHIGNVRDVVSDGDVTLLRCVELLDLNPYGRTYSSHHDRTAVTCQVNTDAEAFVSYDPRTRTFRPRLPSGAGGADALVEPLAAVLQQHPPAHVLTLTIARRAAFAYLEPIGMAGAVRPADVAYLSQLGKLIHDQFR